MKSLVMCGFNGTTITTAAVRIGVFVKSLYKLVTKRLLIVLVWSDIWRAIFPRLPLIFLHGITLAQC